MMLSMLFHRSTAIVEDIVLWFDAQMSANSDADKLDFLKVLWDSYAINSKEVTQIIARCFERDNVDFTQFDARRLYIQPEHACRFKQFKTTILREVKQTQGSTFADVNTSTGEGVLKWLDQYGYVKVDRDWYMARTVQPFYDVDKQAVFSEQCALLVPTKLMKDFLSHRQVPSLYGGFLSSWKATPAHTATVAFWLVDIFPDMRMVFTASDYANSTSN